MTQAQFVENGDPFLFYEKPHNSYVDILVALSDGSCVSGSLDNSAKRWAIVPKEEEDGKKTWSSKDDKPQLQLVNTFSGHRHCVFGVVETDRKTIVTGSYDGTLKEWNTTTGECLKTVVTTAPVCCMIKTKCGTMLVCGMQNGTVQCRSLSDIDGFISFLLHSREVKNICELEDGSFVTSSMDYTLKRWEVTTGAVLRTFEGHKEWVYRLMELKSDVIVGATGERLRMWQVSTGMLLRTMNLHSNGVFALIKLSKGMFASGSIDKTVRVWNDKGNCIQTIYIQHTRLQRCQDSETPSSLSVKID